MSPFLHVNEKQRQWYESDTTRTKLERSSAIALHVLETEHHVDINNPEILSKHWPIYRDRMNAEQQHQPPAGGMQLKRQNNSSSMGLNLNLLYKKIIHS